MLKSKLAEKNYFFRCTFTLNYYFLV